MTLTPEEHARMTIADLKRQLRERDAFIHTMTICGCGFPLRSHRTCVGFPEVNLDAYVQEKVDRERQEVSDWIDAYAKSEGLEITLETKTTEEKIRALCTLLSAKAAHEKDRAVLAESEWWMENSMEYSARNGKRQLERLAANRDNVKAR